MKKLFAILLCLTMFIVSTPAVLADENDEELTVETVEIEDPYAGRFTYTAEGLVYDTWNDILYEVDEGYTTDEITSYTFDNATGDFICYGYNDVTEIVEEIDTSEDIENNSGENPTVEGGEFPDTSSGSENPSTSNEFPALLVAFSAVAFACAKRKITA